MNWLAVVVIVAWNISCGMGGKPAGTIKKKIEFDSSQFEDTTLKTPSGADLILDPAVALEVYQETLYPLVSQHCQTCHGEDVSPNFASPDPLIAYNNTIGDYVVDFGDTSDSRLVARPGLENHGCWSECEADALAMNEAIDAWKDGADIRVEDNSAIFVTPPILLKKMPTLKSLSADPPANFAVVYEAEAGTFAAPYISRVDGEASGGDFLVTDSGEKLIEGEEAAMDESLGVIRARVAVPASGEYEVFVRLAGRENPEDSLFYRIDNGDTRVWDISTQNGADAGFRWYRLRQRANENQPGNQRELSFDWSGGLHQIEFRQRSDGLKIDAIAVANSRDVDLDEVQPSNPQELIGLLQWDVGALIGEANKDVQFAIEVQEYTGNSYVFNNPELTFPSGEFEVRNIKVLVNERFDSRSSHYTAIRETLTAPGKILSTVAMPVLKDKGIGKDSFSISFEVIKRAKP